MRGRTKYMKNRILSLVICTSMILTNLPVTALASETLQDGICEHHTEHTAECGYSEAEGKTCTYECVECGQEGETDSKSETETEIEKVTETESQTKTETETEATTEAESQTETEKETEAATEAESQTETEKETEKITESEDETEAESDSEKKETEPVEKTTVDFMEYLEEPLTVMFRSAEEIDLRSYLINAYGVPEEIDFTCSPAVVSYGEYQDGDTFDLTVTADGEYAGSCTVEAEVYYTEALYPAPPTVKRLIAQNADYNDAVGKKLLDVTNTDGYTVAFQRETGGGWWGNFDGVFQKGFSPNFTIRVYASSSEYVGADGWGRQGDGKAIYKDFTFNFQNAPVTGLPTVTWSNIEPTWPIGYDIVDLIYNGKEQDFVTIGSYEKCTIVESNCKGTDVGEYNAEVKVTLNQGITLIEGSADTEYYTVSWVKDSNSDSIYTKSNTVTIKPANLNVTVTNGSYTSEYDEACTPEKLVESSGAGLNIQGVGNDGTIPADITYTWADGTSASKTLTPGEYTIKATITPTGDKAKNYNTAVKEITVGVKQIISVKGRSLTSYTYDGTGHSLISYLTFRDGVTPNYSIYYKDDNGQVYTGSNRPVNVGNYEVYVQLVGDKYVFNDNKTEDQIGSAKISKRSVFISAKEQTITYGDNIADSLSEVIVDNLADGHSVTAVNLSTTNKNVTNNGVISVDSAAIKDSAGNDVTGNYSINYVPGTLIINPKSVTASITGGNKIYDGTANAENAQIILDGVVSNDDVVATANISYADAKVSYQDGAVIGKTVTAADITLTGNDANNYKLQNNTATATATISPRPVTVIADGASKVYGEDDPSTFTYKVDEITPLVNGENLVGKLERKAGETADTYVIGAGTLTNENNPNYAITFNEGTFTINQRELTVDVVVNNKQYDGLKDATYTAQLKGVQKDDAVTLITKNVTAVFEDETVGNNKKVTLSTFTIDCTEEVGKNYYLTQPTGLTADIYNTYEATEYIVDPTNWTNGSVTITAADGYLVAMESADGAEWKSELTFDEQTAKEGQEVTFYLRNDETKAISLPETVTYYIDKSNPTGTITLGETSWAELLSSMKFDLLFKDMQTVTITAEDSLSDIKSVEYYESDKALTQAEVEAITEWQPYNDSVNVTLEDAKKFIYFAKLTDNAGNVTYLSTDGAVYDTSAPMIDGVEEKEYCTTQTVTVTDVNLDKVTLNGEEVTSPFKLEGNTEAIYTIVATDKVGNSTTMSVTMKPINVVNDPVKDLNATNVNSDHKEDLQNVLDKIDELITDDDVTDEEKTDLENIKTNVEELLDTIKKAEDAITTEEVKKVENLDSSNATLEDKEELQNAKDALESAWQEHGTNYTEEEGKAIEDEIARITEVIASIERTEEVISDINGLPESVETDLSEEEENALLDIKAAYDSLSDHEKSLVDEASVEKLERLLAILTDYKIIEGDGSKWTKGSGKKLTFVVNGPYRKFAYVEVDGKEVETDIYLTASGSTVIELKASYLEKLSEGKHSITVYYADGEAEGTFKVLAAPSETEGISVNSKAEGMQQKEAAKTGDTTNIWLWIAAWFVSAGMILGILKKTQRRRREL